MKKTILFTLISLTLAFSNFTTAQIIFDNGYYDYTGTLNEKSPLTLSLYNKSGMLTGGYVVSGSSAVMTLTGSVSDDRFTIKEYDAKRHHIATFEGTVRPDDTLEGSRLEIQSGKSQSFHLSLRSALPGTRLGHRYENAGFKSDSAVDAFAQKIKKALKEGDKNTLANAMNYPISVKINGEHVVIKNAKTFVAQYNGIFHPTFKKALLDEPPYFLFANDQGVMFGSDFNNLWIGTRSGTLNRSQPIVVSINN